MQEVGYEDIFNEGEINEIKDLYEKAQTELVEPAFADPDQKVQLDTTTVQQVAEQQEGPRETKIEPKFTLKSHFDIVRGAQLVRNDDTLVTVSEDCMVKCWSLPTLDKDFDESKGNIEPYITLRGHTGPILAVTGRGE